MSLKDRLRYPHDPEIRAVAAPEGADEIKRLEAENAQKEKALRDIVNVRDVEGWGLETARGIARKTLKESEG